jgi:DNA-binding XRE family transcriptional regulator
MNDARQKRLQAAGYKVGTVSEFLDLSADEEAYVNIKAALAMRVRSQRRSSAITQTELAKRTGSSQSRIAKLEAGDPSVSIDLLVRVLITLGASEQTITSTLTDATPSAPTRKTVTKRGSGHGRR